MYHTKNDSNEIVYIKAEINRLLKQPLPSNIISGEEFKDKYNELCNAINDRSICNNP